MTIQASNASNASKSSNADSLIRVLVVGVGSIGERHVRCYLNTQKTQVSICEPNPALREKIAAGYNVASAYDNLDEALQQSWDTIVIATPAQLHVKMARQAIKAGVKFVLIEKPLAVTSEGVSELQAEAKAAGATVAVAYVTRSHPAAAAMRQAIVSGRFGEPVQLSLISGQNFPFFRPAYASTYYANHATGGGCIQDGLTHQLNLAEWFIGPITRLAALASHRVLETPNVEDTVSILAEHGSISATYSANQHQPVNENRQIVTCTKGICKFETHNHTWSWANKPGDEWHQEPTKIVERDDWFIKQCDNWLKVIQGQGQPDCTLDEAIQTLKVNQAALQSAAAKGQWQEIH